MTMMKTNDSDPVDPDFGSAHVTRMPFAIRHDESPDPAHVRLLGSFRQSQPPHPRTHLIQ